MDKIYFAVILLEAILSTIMFGNCITLSRQNDKLYRFISTELRTIEHFMADRQQFEDSYEKHND